MTVTTQPLSPADLITVPDQPPAPDPRDPELRLRALFDGRSMQPLASGSGVVTGTGTVDGVRAVALATDATVRGGALSAAGCSHLVAAIETAVRDRVPVIGVWHSGGALLTEGVAALDGVGRVFQAMVRASGVVPQISVVLGPAAGGAAYGPALGDVVIMSESGRVFVTGPDVVRSVTGEQVDMEQLGGPGVHGRQSGVAHVSTPDDATALQVARQLAGLLGAPGRVSPEAVGDSDDLAASLPTEHNRAYDVRTVVRALLDEPGVELHAKWAPSLVTTLGRFAGGAVGVVANNPLRLGGCLDAASADKAARFVRMCDSLGAPLVVLVDVPGYLPGLRQETGGVVRRGAKLLHAFAEAVVPRVTLVTRKAYGGAYIAMNSRALGATAVFAWPDAEVAVMDARAAVNILHRRQLAATPPEQRPALADTLVAEQEKVAGGVRRALEIGVVDEVVAVRDTRRRIAQALAAAPLARGDHGNIPL